MARTKASLIGRVVAITGGARGIGRATAKALTAEGAKVAIGDLDPQVAGQTAAELGGSVRAYELDVTDRDSFERFIDSVERDLGPLDVLINNAGIMPVGRFLDESDESAVRQIDINVHGVIHGMKIALPRMLERNRGHVVNLASSAGKGGFPGVATYCGTKHAVIGISEAVRGELHETPIEISCVMPAIVNTELTAGVEPARGVKNSEPEDVANAIVDALRSPKFDVYVPRSIGPISKVMSLLPRRGREAVARALKADRVVLEADMSKRAHYEDRAAHSEPGVPPAEGDIPAAEREPAEVA